MGLTMHEQLAEKIGARVKGRGIVYNCSDCGCEVRVAVRREFFVRLGHGDKIVAEGAFNGVARPDVLGGLCQSCFNASPGRVGRVTLLGVPKMAR